MTPRQTAILPLALLVAALAPVFAGSAMAASAKRTITLSATGRVLARPDMARISTGVVSEAKTAREALDANSRAMARVIKGLKAQDIADADMRTSDFQVRPKYQHYRDGRPREIVGYQVSNTVHIRVRDLSRLGQILDMVVSLGSNQIGGIAFEVKNAEKLRDEARRKAVETAIARARLYARAAGVRLGKVLRIEEGGAAPVPRPFAERTAIVAKAAPPIEAGSQTIEAHVTMTWSLR